MRERENQKAKKTSYGSHHNRLFTHKNAVQLSITVIEKSGREQKKKERKEKAAL